MSLQGHNLSYKRIKVIDSHTGGEPTRVVVSGGPDIGSGSMAERLDCFRRENDAFRSAVVNEPRGNDAIVGAAGSEVRKNNDPFAIIRTATPEKIKSIPFLYLDCGTEDFLFQSNRDFIGLLLEKKVRHEFRQLPGSHDWPYWNKQVKEFLEVTDAYFGAK